MKTEKNSLLRFAVAVSKEDHPDLAGSALAESILAEMGGSPIDLAVLFLSSHYIPQTEELARVVRKNLSPRVLLGCTGEGIIGGSEEIEGSPAATLWVASLPNVQLTPLRLPPYPEDEPSSVSGWPKLPEFGNLQPVFLLLADPFSAPMKEVLSSMSDRWPGAVAIGGLAGGGRDRGENRVLLDEEVFDEGLVGVALSGQVHIRTVISQGCRPVGDRFVVTKADQNFVHELGGKPALEQLQAVFGSLSPEERHLAHNALHLGIAVDEHRDRFERGDFLVRNLIGADQVTGSLAIGDVVEEGQTVQFHVRDAGSASEDLGLLVAGDRVRHTQPPLGALLFSCCGRGRGLFGRPHHDITAVRKGAGEIPVAGFFAQGEIGPIGGENFLHGYTASIALFSELPS